MAVYAVDAYALGVDGRAPYVMQRLAPPQTTFHLSVPPSLYKVVARLDSDPVGGAGYTFNMACRAASSCGRNLGNTAVINLRVESRQTVANVNIGDWGSFDSQRTLLQVDVHGAPLTHGQANPRSVPSRSLPIPAHELPNVMLKPLHGYRLWLPATWREIFPATRSDDDFYANEAVASPLQLDSSGLWLTVRVYLGSGCPGVDWRYPTAIARVPMQDGNQDFYFENPSGTLGRQPFTGYVFRGGHAEFGNCIAFIFTGASRNALDSNLPAVAGILTKASFQPES